MINGINEKVSQLYDSSVNFASKKPWEGIALVTGGVALSILFPPVIIPVTVTFASILAGKGIVYIKEKASCKLCEKIISKATDIDAKYPWLKWVSLIFTVSIALINPVAGAVVGGIAGVYVGIAGISNAAQESISNA